MQKDLLSEELNYISTIKHDFSIPVIAQIRALEMLADEKFGVLNIEQKEIINMTLTSCRSIYDMMSQILYSYKLQTEQFELNKADTDIIKLIKECFVCKNFEYKKKNILVKVICDEKTKILKCDIDKIRKAFLYIVDYCFSNALEKSRINCYIKISKKEMKISINFENPFSKNTHLNKIGSNIQLNLAENIIKAHKGKMQTEQNNITIRLTI